MRRVVGLGLLAAGGVGMAGCASPLTLYHQAEGGDIAKLQGPPPGSDLAYPNLASVPAAPAALTANEKQAVAMQLQAARVAPAQPDGAPAPASTGALAGLALPNTTPPLPSVPGINLHGLPTVAAPALPPAAAAIAPAVPPDGPPILLAFSPKSAILSPAAKTALTDLALTRGTAGIRVAGFGELDPANAAPNGAALALGLQRARRMADALTAAGVPPAAITLIAVAGGSGGFAQLVY